LYIKLHLYRKSLKKSKG